ncbi:MAG: DNA gyrase C-terminal beta-propeller domain-containing protein, partial [Siphonobacter sp.]
EGISAIRDESSNREGIRLVIEIKKDAVPNVVLNNLYKHTPLQTAFSVNNVALVKGRPMTLNLKDLIRYFVEHRLDVIVRRAKYDLREARKRAHILEGLLVALDHLDAVIALIRSSRDPDVAKAGLMNGDFMTAAQKTAFLSDPKRTLQIVDSFQNDSTTQVLSEAQARAILDMRLQRLTGLERDKIVEEYNELMKIIADLEEILASPERQRTIIKEELSEIKARYGDERRTQISHADDELSIEDMIADEEMLITISSQGYMKRTLLSEYRTQSRGGVGARGVKTKNDDFTEHLFTATMHNYLLFFTDTGKCFWLRVFNVPEGNKTAKGRPIQNLINIESGDRIRAVINVKTLSDPDYINNNFIVMCTEQGIVKKTSLEAYSRPRQNGIIAVNINEGDRLLDVALTNGNNEVIIAIDAGRAVRFNEEKVRPMGRTATGVKGVELAEDEKVIGMVCVADSSTAQLLVVSEQGYGKRSDIEDYRLTNRGGKGVTTLKLTEKTGKLVAIKQVTDNDDLMIINKSGIAIRFAVADLRVMGRNTQGVRLINLRNGDEISSITKIEKEEEELTEGQEENGNDTPPEVSPEV